MKTDEIRERFIEFFRKRGHTVHPSDSLIPSNDPSLLFTSAGMAQFKDMFLGRGTLPFRRATTCQKCLRTGDLERVGKTSGHHTFFEMLGNFSFGDYFKRETIAWAWEFSTREMRIPEERIHVTVYRDDDEAFRIWSEEIGLPAARIRKLGEADNFWPANAPSQGPNGPCGPCSELYYDFGPNTGCGRPECAPGCSCDRFVEFWNLVFTQFDRQEDGTLAPLPQKNIDTGAGLERFAAVLQGVHSNFDTDNFKPLILSECALLKVSYTPGTETAARLRRIADHARALVFCISDNARPGPTGRGYVVRRILRTAVRDGMKLGLRQEFLHRLVPEIIAVMRQPYPYLEERRRTIETVIKDEERKFLDSLDRAERELRDRLAGQATLSGQDAFYLYDTHGLPIELLEDLCHDLGARVERAEFDRILKEKQESQRKSSEIMDTGALARIKERRLPTTRFLGYEIPMAEMGRPVDATVAAIARLDAPALKAYQASKKDAAAVTTLLKSAELVEEAAAGTDIAAILDRTPFYGDAGGQVGDSGWLRGEALEAEITDTKRPDDYFTHLGRVTRGSLRVGQTVRAQIDADRRLNIMRHHTGTHVLQAALRTVLGKHVEQAGSIVLPDRLRFDFTHPKALTRDEIRAVEDWANRVILSDLPVAKVETSMEDAKQRGAIMFFGEKYGDRVRVVSIGEGASVELCGGTHLEHTSTISQLKIVSESSIGSGVRRIEAVTGPKAIELAREKYDLAEETARELGCPIDQIPKRLKQLVQNVLELKSEIGRLKSSGRARADALREAAGIISPEEELQIGSEKVCRKKLNIKDVNEAREFMDELVKNRRYAAAILAIMNDKPVFVIGVREDLAQSKGLKAGDLAKEVGKACGGGGGGRELQAQAGASDPSKIELGFQTFESAVRAKFVTKSFENIS
ncbi:MAG: alanine--tRNA ligase [Planctomycetes bacterium]|nr:alanine--tRNA ligase [Planctomycetota bacterium]